MANSAAQICNEALALIGADPITSLNEQTVVARLANSLYGPTRDELLVSHPWKFATKRALLAADPVPPAFGFSYRFALPVDSLRVIGTNLGSTAEWTEEDGYLLCNHPEVGVKYISRVTTEGTFSTPFSEALAYKLAGKMAFPITQNQSLAQNLFQVALVHLKDAKSMNAQAAQGQVVGADDWLHARY